MLTVACKIFKAKLPPHPSYQNAGRKQDICGFGSVKSRKVGGVHVRMQRMEETRNTTAADESATNLDADIHALLTKHVSTSQQNALLLAHITDSTIDSAR